MFWHSNIFAASSDDGPGKFIFGVIFLAVWALSAIMTQASKKREQERRERVRRQIEQEINVQPPVSPVPAPPPRMQMPRQMLQQRRQAAIARRAPQVQRKVSIPKIVVPTAVQRRRPTPPVIPAAAARPVPQAGVRTMTVAPTATAVPTPAAPPKPVSATAMTLRAWLKPETLRQQFILTEILQPPVGLRANDMKIV